MQNREDREAILKALRRRAELRRGVVTSLGAVRRLTPTTVEHVKNRFNFPLTIPAQYDPIPYQFAALPTDNIGELLAPRDSSADGPMRNPVAFLLHHRPVERGLSQLNYAVFSNLLQYATPLELTTLALITAVNPPEFRSMPHPTSLRVVDKQQRSLIESVLQLFKDDLGNIYVADRLKIQLLTKNDELALFTTINRDLIAFDRDEINQLTQGNSLPLFIHSSGNLVIYRGTDLSGQEHHFVDSNNVCYVIMEEEVGEFTEDNEVFPLTDFTEKLFTGPFVLFLDPESDSVSVGEAIAVEEELTARALLKKVHQGKISTLFGREVSKASDGSYTPYSTLQMGEEYVAPMPEVEPISEIVTPQPVFNWDSSVLRKLFAPNDVVQAELPVEATLDQPAFNWGDFPVVGNLFTPNDVVQVEPPIEAYNSYRFPVLGKLFAPNQATQEAALSIAATPSPISEQELSDAPLVELPSEPTISSAPVVPHAAVTRSAAIRRQPSRLSFFSEDKFTPVNEVDSNKKVAAVSAVSQSAGFFSHNDELSKPVPSSPERPSHRKQAPGSPLSPTNATNKRDGSPINSPRKRMGRAPE